MIQRKQTIYLALAFFLTMVCLSTQIGTYNVDGITIGKVYNLWVTDSQGFHHFTTWPLMVVLLPTGVLALCTVFLYKNRILQARLCTACMFLMIAWYILYVVITNDGITLTYSAILPAICAILYFLARQGIVSDEKLVRSMDRIR